MKSAFLLAAITLALFSCRKEPVVPPGLVEFTRDTIPNNGTILDYIVYREISWDSRFQEKPYITEIKHFYYDPSHRLKEILDSNRNGLSSSRVFSYFNNDTVPSLVIRKISSLSALISIDTLFLWYNDNDEIIKDSTVKYNWVNSSFPGQLSQKTSSEYVEISPGNFWYRSGTFERYSHQIYQQGNVMSHYDSVPRSSVTKFNYTYDNHPNPFYKFVLRYPDPDPAYFMEDGPKNKNNLLTNTTIRGGYMNPSIDSVHYTYNSEGYPATITGDLTGNNKLILFYKYP